MEEKNTNLEKQTKQNGHRRKLIYASAAIGLMAVIAVFVALITTKKPAPTTISPVHSKMYNYIAPSEESCLKLKDAAQISFCMDKVIAAQAINDRDITKCANIKNNSLRNDCNHFMARNLADEKICDVVEEGRGSCLSDVSIAKKDPSICDLLDEDEKYELQECKDRTMAFILAEDGNKETLGKCTELKTLEYSKLCLENSYANKFDGDCSQVPEAYRNYCLAISIIQGGKNTKIEDCAKISLDNPQETLNYQEFCNKVVQLGFFAAIGVDSDNDGISDGNELFMNTDPYNPDTDGDGLSDGEEWIIYETDPQSKDTDGDGIDDYQEVMNNAAGAGEKPDKD
jgi:hypothetical protein